MTQRLEALLPMTATEGVEDQLHTASIGETGELSGPVLVHVVDCRVQATGFEKRVLARAGGAVDGCPEITRNVDRSQTYPAAGVVDQHRLARVECAHHHQQLPGGQVIHRDRGALLVT